MKPAARLYAIFNHIEKYGDTSLVELAKIFSVSEMTIRRNVESLQTDGAVQISTRSSFTRGQDIV